MIKRIFKLHYIYIFNKPIILLSIFIVILSFILYFITGLSIHNQNSSNDVVLYNDLIYNYTKLIIVIITIVIVCYSFLSENDYYKIFIYKDINLNIFLFTKIILLFVYIIFILIVELLISNFISLIIFYRIDIVSFLNCLDVLIISILYFFLGLISVVMFDYFYIIIILFIIYLTFESSDINQLLIDNYIMILFISMILLLYSSYLYSKKDIIV